jgi:hypothetical protein
MRKKLARDCVQRHSYVLVMLNLGTVLPEIVYKRRSLLNGFIKVIIV